MVVGGEAFGRRLANKGGALTTETPKNCLALPTCGDTVSGGGAMNQEWPSPDTESDGTLIGTSQPLELGEINSVIQKPGYGTV